MSISRPTEKGALDALQSPEALMLVSGLSGGLGMVQHFLCSRAEEPAAPVDLLVTGLREIRHAAAVFDRLAREATDEMVTRYGVDPKDAWRSDDEGFLTIVE